MLDRRPGGRDALGAEHLASAALAEWKDRRQVARRAVQVRLDHLQDEARGHRGVEGVAAPLEHAEAQPPRRSSGSR